MKKIILIVALLILSGSVFAQSKSFSLDTSIGYSITSVTNLLRVVYLNEWSSGEFNLFVYNKSDTSWLQGSFDSSFTRGKTFDIPPNQWTAKFNYSTLSFRKLFFRRKYNVAGTIDYGFEIKNTQ